METYYTNKMIFHNQEKKKSKKGRNVPREEETQEMKMLERSEKGNEIKAE